jgi:hypothetical protein
VTLSVFLLFRFLFAWLGVEYSILFSIGLLGQNFGLHLSAATAKYFILAQAVESGVNTG